ncbi:MAG: hypothetical protein RJA44_2057 [Pseudomonadota bacterium]
MVLPVSAPAVQPANAAGLTVDRNLLLQAIGLQQQGQIEAAERLLRIFLAAFPLDGAGLYSLAVILMQRGDMAASLALLQPAAEQGSAFAPFWFAHASTLQGLGRRTEALQSYQRAIDLQPDYIDALLNSGVLLRDMHQHLASLQRFQQVLQLKPDHQSALSNCATLLVECKRGAEAVAMLERLLQLNPDYDYGIGSLCYEKLHACDWSDHERLAQLVVAGVQAGKRSSRSLGLMAITDSAEVHQRCARTFAADRYSLKTAPLWSGERYRHQRIRLAYVSPDLREHPVGHLMAGIFERHDRRRFELIAISIGIDDGSRLRARMQATFDRFIDARALGSRQIAELMRTLEIDVAVDLAGYTSDSRSDIFLHRPAPVQVNYLGYPGTLGARCMDYILADPYVIPPENQRYFDEQVVYLPDNYLPPAADVRIAERTPSRAECGLPEQGVVFCSFNHDYKISPHIFAVWMRLLQRVPGSVLWLMSRSEVSQRNLRQAAEAQGVAPDRLVFAQRVPRVEDHLARYRQADLFLDTHPYNAHTTAADALSAGLPVLTYSGSAFPARVAGSLLQAAGLPELITHTLADYEELAVALALDSQRRAELRERLARQRHDSALFDLDGFCRNLESSYIAMWRKAQLGTARDAL